MNKPASIPSTLLPEERLYQGAPPAPHQVQELTSEIVEYWRAITLRKWSILALASVVAVITFVVVSQMIPVYRSHATVLVEIDPPPLIPFGSKADTFSGPYYKEYFQTQVQVLKSNAVAKRVVAQLDLTQHPEFDPRQRKPSAVEKWMTEHFPDLASLIWKKSVGALDEGLLEAKVLDKFGDRLRVDPVRQSQLIYVVFESRDPQFAAKVANATARAYIQADAEARSTTRDNTGQVLGKRLADLKANSEKSALALQAYRDQEGMLDSKSNPLGGTGRQVDELTQKLVAAQIRRSEAEQAYRQVKAGEVTGYEPVPAGVKSPSAVQAAKGIEAAAEKRFADVSQHHGPGHPTFLAASSDLASARANTHNQLREVVSSFANEYQAARATEKSIEAALSQAKGTIQTLNRKEIALNVLKGEAATNRQLYQTFLTRVRETSATKDAVAINARLVDPALPALLPFRPDKARAVAIATFCGLLLGAFGAVLLKRLNNTIETSEDVEHKLRQPFLAALPVLRGKDKKNFSRIVLDHSKDQYAESVRTVSTGVLLSALYTPNMIIAVSSSVAAEGKSTFAINLALSQSKSKDVILIEGDMRRPCFSEVLNLPSEQRGMSQLISGAATLDECLRRIDGTNLHVIPAGKIPLHPMELLVSKKFRDLLAMLRDRCHLVIIDSPPVQLVSDALVIGSQSTGVIYMMKTDNTPAALAKAGLKRFESANIPVFGVVLNQQDFKKAEKYYGQPSGYGKYGYEAAYGATKRRHKWTTIGSTMKSLCVNAGRRLVLKKT